MRNRLFLIFLLFINSVLFGQKNEGFFNRIFKYKREISVRKFGPYVGLQKGKFTFLELGGEYQIKKLQLVNPPTHAFHFGFDYNFGQNILGWEAGYWYKQGRLNLTYGLNLNYKTNFDDSRVGFSPVLGFKLFQFHLQTGLILLNKRTAFESNSIFISLRFVLINDRDIKVKKVKK